MAYSESGELTFNDSGESVSTVVTNTGGATKAALFVKVSGASSTAQIHVYLEDSPNGTDWYQAAVLSGITNGSKVMRVNSQLADNVRARALISNGSANVTAIFSMS